MKGGISAFAAISTGSSLLPANQVKIELTVAALQKVFLKKHNTAFRK